MDKFDRIFQLHAIHSARRTPVPLEDLMARLECSRATLYRAVTALKDQLNAPIVYDAEADLTKHQRLNLGEAASRLRFPAIAARLAGPAFGAVASATLQRKRLWIEYHVRSSALVPGCLGRRQGRAAQLRHRPQPSSTFGAMTMALAFIQPHQCLRASPKQTK